MKEKGFQKKIAKIDAVSRALSSIYTGVFCIDLVNDSYDIISSPESIISMLNGITSAQQAISKAIQNTVPRDELLDVLTFVNLDTIPDRMRSEKCLDINYKGTISGWVRGSFIEVERDGTGKPIQILYTYQVIDEEKQKELEHLQYLKNSYKKTEQDNEEKKQSLEYYNTLTKVVMEQLNCGIMVYTVPGRNLLQINPEALRIMGWKNMEEAAEKIGNNWDIVTLLDGADEKKLSDLRNAESSVKYQFVVNAGKNDEKRILAESKSFAGRSGGSVIISTLTDVTHVTVLEKELEDALKQAKHANEAKSNFLFNMSHDIRTPMNALLGYNQLMGKELTDPKLRHYQRKIEQSGNLLLSIINNVLDMARIEKGKIELDENYVQVKNIVEEIHGVFESTAKKKGVQLIIETEVEHQHLMCDITKIKQIFVNLVSNAVKYTASGGKVIFRTQELFDDSDVGDGFVRIKSEVIDTGIGMSREYLPKLFDAFSRERNTTTGKVAGTGLGMPIVKELVERMNGSIEVESELGKGSKFTVIIPCRIADKSYYEQKIEAVASSNKKQFLQGKRILLAEDNELNAEIAVVILEDMGLKVDRVEDGIQCVSRIEQMDAGSYDAILMDIQMPNMNGYKATRAIRNLPDKNKANIPIIAMTANAFEEDRKKAFSEGMNEHIAKPIEVAKVEEILVSILG